MREFKRDQVPKLKPETLKMLSNFTALSDNLYLEIGCGVGLHPILFSKTQLDKKLIAIERTQEKFKKFEGRFINHKSPSNLLPLHADAISVVTHGLSTQSINKVFILYPNPEPGNKNQRWINMPFMTELISKLKKNGEIEIRTNILEYAEEIKANFSQHNLTLTCYRTIHKDEKLKTHFEHKYIKRGEVCYEIILKVKNHESKK